MMSRESKIVRNSAILAVQHVLINVISIFIVGYIARFLGKQDYGVYSLAFAFPAIFEFIGSLGLRPLMIREIARNKEGAIDYFGRVIPVRAILISLMAISILVAAISLNYEKKIIYAIIISIGSSFCEQFSRMILDFFQAFEEMGKVALRDIIVRVFTAVTSIAVIILGHGLYAVCGVYFAGSILGLIINIWLYRRRFAYPILKFDYQFTRDQFKEGGGYILFGFAVALYPKIDILLLSKMTDTASLGIYNASSNLFYKLNFMADSVATAAFPALSELFWTNRSEANNIFNKAFRLIIFLSFPVAIGGFILSQQIITLIYGNSYIETVPVFSLLTCSIPLMFINTLLYSSLGAVRQQNYVAKVAFLNVIVGLISNVIFIKLLGYIGAAIATLITQAVGCIIFVYRVKKYYKYDFRAKTIISLVFSLICLGVATYITIPIGIFLSIPIAAGVYYMCLRICGQLQNVGLMR